MSEDNLDKKQNQPTGSSKFSASDRQLWLEDSSSSIDEVRRRALNCVQVASVACYSYTMAMQAMVEAFKAREEANQSTTLAHKLTEIANILRKQAQEAASAVCSDNQALAQLYVSAQNKTISFYNFITTVMPEDEETYYDKPTPSSLPKESKNYMLEYTTSLDTTASSYGCDSFTVPEIKKVKSISELNDFYRNIIGVSDKMRKSKTIESTRAPSPLLNKEDTESVEKSSNSSYHEDRPYRYALRKSNSSNSSTSEHLDDRE